MAPLYDSLIAALWAAIVIFWIVSSFSAKRSARGGSRGFIVRLLVLGSVLLIYHHNAAHRLSAGRFAGTSDLLMGWLGALLCAAGLSFAVWARLHLGRNWGMPMTVKAEPQLVTSGPYAYVRHPIYSGAFVAILGTVLAAGPKLLLLPAILSIYFIYSATQEERLMSEQFPLEYPEYKRRTKMLLPFIY